MNMNFSWNSLVARRLLLTVSALLIASTVSFAVLAHKVHEHNVLHTDIVIIEFVRQFHSDTLDKLIVIATNCAGPAAIGILGIALTAFLYYKHKRHAAVFTLIAVCGAIIIGTLLKLIFVRDRPDLWVSVVTETGYSFPSGHATASSILGFTTIALFWATKWRWYAVVLAALYIVTIGFTRVYLGVHYPSDVVAAWSVSLAWIILVKFAMDYSDGVLQRRRKSKLLADTST
jgi:membrane-associated phospholipid phosphatase